MRYWSSGLQLLYMHAGCIQTNKSIERQQKCTHNSHLLSNSCTTCCNRQPLSNLLHAILWVITSAKEVRFFLIFINCETKDFREYVIHLVSLYVHMLQVIFFKELRKILLLTFAKSQKFIPLYDSNYIW